MQLLRLALHRSCAHTIIAVLIPISSTTGHAEPPNCRTPPAVRGRKLLGASESPMTQQIMSLPFLSCVRGTATQPACDLTSNEYPTRTPQLQHKQKRSSQIGDRLISRRKLECCSRCPHLYFQYLVGDMRLIKAQCKGAVMSLPFSADSCK